ncbi:probable indole-3-pyruvate monooxygenase YUCCA10 [Mercurialis annua]|uniref:probable indole-3-pyruvate monooxygenase YUCCA10 n=1 Tax=Mercurialis annua TaxID=3986 RepID=UPI00215ECFFE|nr:probable indole-3-pyruvate monooxygenase YUCCA10 [Mercurialis annua]
MEAKAMIIGAGPAGLATSVCLSHFSISNILLEREDCAASLWTKHSYDRLHLHIGKEFCELPYFPHQTKTSTFMPKNRFIEYIDNYISFFDVNPRFNRCVRSAFFDNDSKKWIIEAKNSVSGESEIYFAEFLVVATGENSKGFIPKISGMDTFLGEIIHSSEYRCGAIYEGKNVLVVGSGNSGMEISLDLSNYGANTSIVVRSSFHVVTREMVYLGMLLLTFVNLPLRFVDMLITFLSKAMYGDLSKYGLHRPSIGPFASKILTGKAPVIDVGTVKKIRSKEIKVVPAITNVNHTTVEFSDNTMQHFDAIVLATGYKSIANEWLKDYHYILNEEGMPKNKTPNHWKGENGIYCVGFAKNGIPGISKDAKAVAEDIHAILSNQVSKFEV